jgi:hypothetical protein
MMGRPQSFLYFLLPGVVVILLVGYFLLQTSAGPSGTIFGPEQVISTENDGPKRIFAADMDGDGDEDVLSISLFDDKIAWYENMDGQGSFGLQNLISTQIDGGDGVSAADLDGDGDLDVLSASSTDGKIAWYENINGAETFGPQQMINSLAPMAYFVVAVDFDGDDDFDVLYDAWDMNVIAWQENQDGQGTFGPVNTITTRADGASSVFAADLDGDNDMDALSTAAIGNKVFWHENTNGFGNFSSPITITLQTEFPYSVFATDLDGDGDQDVLSASAGDNKIAWYENTDGQGNFGPQNIINDEANLAAAVFAADLDRDGDQDVLSASSGDDTIAWYENDGSSKFGAEQVITAKADNTFSVIATDLDEDGDLDVIAASLGGDQISWFENLTPIKRYFPIIFKQP